MQTTQTTEIKASELRLGNWLGSRWVSTPERVDYFQVNSIRGGEDWSMIEPIPLTPEILEKAGFGRDNDCTWAERYILNKEVEANTIEKEGDGYAFYASEWTFGKPFQHLHQLQNLFFALCGKELEIDLA